MNKKINKIIFLSSLISIIFFGSCLLVYIHVHWRDNVGYAFEILTIISAAIVVLIGIISGIIFLTRDWNNKYINKNKLIWSILSFFPLFSIASLIFSCIISSVYMNNDVEYVYKNLIKNKQCRTTYEILSNLDELYKKGIISEELYLKQKEKILD